MTRDTREETLGGERQAGLGEVGDGDSQDPDGAPRTPLAEATEEALDRVTEPGKIPRVVADKVAEEFGFGQRRREVLVERVLEEVGEA